MNPKKQKSYETKDNLKKSCYNDGNGSHFHHYILQGVFMMNIFIVDDDMLFVQQLKKDIYKFISTLEDDICIHTYTESYTKMFLLNQIDIVFLDVNLESQKEGFKIGTKINDLYPKALLIYISNVDSFVYPALSFNIFQFIRKNNYEIDFMKTCRKLEKYIKEHIKKTIIYVNGRKQVLTLDQIKYVMSIGHDLHIQYQDQMFIISSSIKSFLDSLDYKDIVQIQRNMAINLNQIEVIKNNEILMKDHQTYNVGRIYRNDFEQAYNSYLLR